MYQEQRLSKMLELLEDKGQLAAKDMVDIFRFLRTLFDVISQF